MNPKTIALNVSLIASATTVSVSTHAQPALAGQPLAQAATIGALEQRPQPFGMAEADGPVTEIEMYVGESRAFPATGVARIAVGNGKVLTAMALDGKSVLLSAIDAGMSSLTLWRTDGSVQRARINAGATNVAQQLKPICEYLSGIPRVNCKVVGGSAVVEGSELPDADMARVAEVAKRYAPVVNMTSRVGSQQMICMEVKVVEFPINALRDLGLKWSATGGAAMGAIWSPANRGASSSFVLASPPGSPVTAAAGLLVQPPSSLVAKTLVNLGLVGSLSLLQQQGTATMLAEPRLCALSMTKASFLAGGEVPYTVQSQQGPGVVFKTYGVKLDITPRLEASGVIRAAVAAEVSSVDTSVQTSSGPALSTRRTETEFNVRAGETLVLSGLLQRTTSTDVEKVPFLGDLPYIGPLFRSTRYLNKETELVVFVTPTMTSSSEPDNVDRIERTHERLQQEMGAAPYLSRPIQPAARTSGADGGAAGDDRRAAPGETLTVIAPDTVLRAAPAAGAPGLMRLAAGTAVVSASSGATGAASPEWRLVRFGSTLGWLPAAALRTENS